MMGFTVVGKPAATVITSSPGFRARSPNFGEVSAEKASRFADDPELVVNTCFTPRKAASFFSNASLKRPVVNQPSSEASTSERNSGAPMTLPETGTGVSPGTNVPGLHDIAANCSTRSRIWDRRSFTCMGAVPLVIYEYSDLFSASCKYSRICTNDTSCMSFPLMCALCQSTTLSRAREMFHRGLHLSLLRAFEQSSLR